MNQNKTKKRVQCRHRQLYCKPAGMDVLCTYEWQTEVPMLRPSFHLQTGCPSAGNAFLVLHNCSWCRPNMAPRRSQVQGTPEHSDSLTKPAWIQSQQHNYHCHYHHHLGWSKETSFNHYMCGWVIVQVTACRDVMEVKSECCQILLILHKSEIHRILTRVDVGFKFILFWSDTVISTLYSISSSSLHSQLGPSRRSTMAP